MPSKTALQLAYDAGQHAANEPSDRRSVEACPFSPVEHPEERSKWLEGFSDALDDVADLRKAVKAARDE